MRCIRNKKNSMGSKAAMKGHTLVELALVIALLTLFGAATLSLVVAGSSAYEGIMEKKNADSELRIALSYIDTKIKQYDSAGVLRLESNPAGDGPALVIEEVLGGADYETWIYFSEGRLREVLVDKGGEPTDDLSYEIAVLEGFQAVYGEDEKLLHITVWSSSKKGRLELDTDIAVKTGIITGR